MRVAVVAESFLPNINGVTNSVLRILEHLHSRGHEAIIIAPGARDNQEEVADYLGFSIVRVPTVRVPLIDSLPVGVPTTTVIDTLDDFEPDLVYLASPFVLGAAGAFAAWQKKIPAVAAYQTDVAGFATKYHLAPLAAAAWEWTRTIHNACELTLAPSTPTIGQLRTHGVNNVIRWGRGVDSVRFNPAKRCEQLRRSWDPTSEKTIVGFVGRLAAEKGVHRLTALSRREDVQVVIVGDGPCGDELRDRLPRAVFTGALGGDELARAYASFDVFVHTGEFETFCQTIQEAQASGVPTIGPRAGGPIDLIQPGTNGLLLEVNTFAEDLEEAIDWVMDPLRHEQLRGQARRGVEKRSWQALCEQLEGYFAGTIEAFNDKPRARLGRMIDVSGWVLPKV